MADYLVRLTLNAPLGSPLHSGTLFGHLCWALRYQDSEAALNDWLLELPEAPFLLSDGLPAGWLPRPLLAPPPRFSQQPGEARDEFREKLEQAKKLRKRGWIRVTDFLALRDGLTETRLAARLDPKTSPPTPRRVRIAHNTIDRHTGTTPDSGGLYFMGEDWFADDARERDVYVRTTLPRERVAGLFSLVGELGFGRDATLGRGQFQASLTEPPSGLFDFEGNRCLSLSHGSRSANMAAPRYKLHTHYGKVGGLYAGGVMSPFKRPLLLCRPGATFAPADGGPFGELLAGVHPHDSSIRHNAWHLTVPFSEAADEESP